MTERATRLRAQVAGGASTDALLAAVDDVLVDGYAMALNGDAWSIRAGRRLHELITQTGGLDRDRQLRALSHEHTCCQHELDDLRRALVGLRAARDGLRAESRAPSA